MPTLLVLVLGLIVVDVGAAPLHVAVVSASQEALSTSAMTSFARGIISRELASRPELVLVELERLDRVLQQVDSLQEAGSLQEADPQQGAAPQAKAGSPQAGPAPASRLSALGNRLSVETLYVVEVQRVYPDYSAIVRVVDVASGQVLHVEEAQLGPHLEQAREPLVELGRRLASLTRTLAPAEMVLIAAGRLSMGSRSGLADERPVHKVQIPTFHLDKYEISRVELHQYRTAGGQTRAAAVEGPDLPASEVSWHEAAAYCRSVGKRLPSEAEWEFAARGEAGALYPWGNAPTDASRARFAGAAPAAVQTLPAGASPLGVHHLAGNVAEWVNDWWAADYYVRSPEPDPPGPAVGDYRVVRGGSFRSSGTELRASVRNYHNPDRGSDDIGFRCARDANP